MHIIHRLIVMFGEIRSYSNYSNGDKNFVVGYSSAAVLPKQRVEAVLQRLRVETAAEATC